MLRRVLQNQGPAFDPYHREGFKIHIPCKAIGGVMPLFFPIMDIRSLWQLFPQTEKAQGRVCSTLSWFHASKHFAVRFLVINPGKSSAPRRATVTRSSSFSSVNNVPSCFTIYSPFSCFKKLVRIYLAMLYINIFCFMLQPVLNFSKLFSFQCVEQFFITFSPEPPEGITEVKIRSVRPPLPPDTIPLPLPNQGRYASPSWV